MGNINVPALLRVAIALVAVLVVAVLIFVFVQQQSTEPEADPVEVGATPTDLAQLDRFGITVQGQASVSLEPDFAIVSLGIEAVGESSSAATAELSTTSTAIVDAVDAAGVESEDIQTSGLSLWPVYGDTIEADESKIIGYRASTQYQITVREISEVGSVIDAALEAGANSIEGIEFSSTELDAQRDLLLATATQQAARKAETIAVSLGGQLGGLIWLEEQYYSQPARPAAVFEAASASSGGQAPAISVGTLTVEAQVRANFGFDIG